MNKTIDVQPGHIW